MSYHLTENQKELARFLVEQVRSGNLSESLSVFWGDEGELFVPELKHQGGQGGNFEGTFGQLDALADSKMLLPRITYRTSDSGAQHEDTRTCTLTALIYTAVDSGFAEEETAEPISTLAQLHPPEVTMSLDRLRAKYPDAKRLGFLIMRFAAAKPFARIVEIIEETAGQNGLTIVRADRNEFHADLWGNIRTHLHGCGFGIAVYERIESDEPSANVGLEVGYLMAMNKPVLLLKDRTVKILQADLAGKLYKEFDPHDPEGTIPGQLTKWLEDYGIIVPKRD